MKQRKQEGILDVIKLIIILVILTILAAVIYAKFFVNKISPEAKQTAIEMHELDPSKSVEEWEKIAGAPLNDAQQIVMENVSRGEPTGEITALEDDNPDDNIVHFVDEAGQEWEAEIAPSDGSTDEENYAEIERILAELEQGIKDYDQGGVEVVAGVTEEDIKNNQDTSPEDSYDEGRDYVEDPSVMVSDPNDDWGFNPWEGMTEEEIQQILEDSHDTEFKIHGT